MIETLSLILVPVLVALIASAPLWLGVSKSRVENREDHAQVVERLAVLETSSTDRYGHLRDSADRTEALVEKVGAKVDNLTVQVAFAERRINVLEDSA
jgi:hypothetical protein